MDMLNEMENQGEGGTKLNKDQQTAKAAKADAMKKPVAAKGEHADKVEDLGEPVVKGDEDSGPFKADDKTAKSKRPADKDNAEPMKDASKAKMVTKAYESLLALDKDTLSERLDSVLAAIAGDQLIEHEVDLSEEVNELLGAEADLSEEFKNKATSLLEARFAQSINEEKIRLNELYDAQLQEEVDAVREDLTGKLDSYLDYAGSEWMSENQLAVDNGIKAEIAESFFSGLRGLMEQHNLEIPADQEDVLEATVSENNELKEQLDASISTILELKEATEELYKQRLLDEACADMTASDKAKIVSLVENASYDSVEELESKIETFVEHYQPASSQESSDKVLSEEMIAESQGEITEEVSDTPVSSDAYVNDLAKAMTSRFGRNK